MMAGIARVGDTSSHGGTIISGASKTFVNGKQVARVGDMHSCPIAGHGTTAITSGSTTVFIEGAAVARIGDSIGCGAVISTGSADVEAG